MTNLYINTYRKKMREPERVSYDEMEDFFFIIVWRAVRRERQAAVRRRRTEVVQRVQIEAIREAIGQLPEEYRSTLILADLNEFSYQEISDMLQIPLGTVRSRLSRGRRLVQKALWAYSENNQR
jgi:RNA polymerase sigma-70 factor (ECF subfamily)